VQFVNVIIKANVHCAVNYVQIWKAFARSVDCK